MSQIQVIDGQA